MASKNNESKDIRTKDGNLKFGHIHEDEVISSIMMQGQNALDYITIDQTGKRQGWIWNRSRGRYQVITGDNIPEDQPAIYISSAGGDGMSPGNIEFFTKGTFKICAENIEFIASGSDNSSGNITLQGNQNIKLDGGKAISIDSKESTSISAAADLNLTATNSMKNSAGSFQQESAASSTKKPNFPVNGTSDFEHITGQMFVTNAESKPEALGRGANRIDGSAYMMGPVQIGKDNDYSKVDATVMISNTNNADCAVPESALYVKGKTTHQGDYKHTGNYNHTGDVTHKGDSTHDGCFTVNTPSTCKSQFNGNLAVDGTITATSTITSNSTITGSEVTAGGVTLTSRKAFDIPHPTKEGWRLRHICLEGPSADVYVRGRVRNVDRINLPEYWMGLVDPRTITVSLTPVGSHQDVVIKRINDNIIFLQSKGGMPIDCFYHVYGERMDGEKLIAEYKGQSAEDYPGNNGEYSVAGYHYDQRG
jgi:hypothetical protein